MGIRLAELVERFGGQLAGDPDLEVTGIAPLDAAGASHVSFLSNSKLRAQALATRAAALVHGPGDEEALAAGYAGARIVTRNPYAWFARAAQYFVSLTELKPAPGIHPSAVVAPGASVDPSAHIGPHVVVEEGARIGARCVIGAGCFIGRDAVIGEDTQMFANVSFHARCIIGKRGILHSGAVIGSDGFGFANEGGVYIKIPQVGRVVMGDDVDIGANTTIDRGAMADTTIGNGVKIDNLVQIAHNVQVGDHTAMAGCVGVAGSTKIGKHCMFGGAAMVNGHIEIVDNVYVTAATLASRSITEPGQYTGFYPFAKNSEWEKGAAIVRNIDAMRDKIRALEKQIKNLVQTK